METRADRLTVIIDSREKALFDDICRDSDLTPSQLVRQFIRDYIVTHAGDRKIPVWLKRSTAKFKEPAGGL